MTEAERIKRLEGSLKKLAKKVLKLERTRGGYSHMSRGMEVSHADYYDEKDVQRLKTLAAKTLKGLDVS